MAPNFKPSFSTFLNTIDLVHLGSAVERSCDHSAPGAVCRDGDRIPSHVQSGIGHGSDEAGPGGSAKPMGIQWDPWGDVRDTEIRMN